MSAMKRYMEDIVDKTAELMVAASGNKYTYEEMESIVNEALEEAEFMLQMVNFDQLIIGSMEWDW